MNVLSEVANDRKRKEARELRASLFARCRSALDQMGDDISGFAIVVWDKQGDMRSAYNAERGPIRAAIVPTLCADALNRHVAVMLAAAKAEEEAG